MMHSFDTQIAQQYGIAEAVLLHNFAFWLAKNKANKQNCHNGRYWTYNSIKAFKELFPYLTEKQIRRALEKLRDEGLIITGNFNENVYDRTLWYSLSEKGMALLDVDVTTEEGKYSSPKGQLHLPKKANVITPEGEPIPDSKPDSKPNNNSSSGSSSSNNILPTMSEDVKTTSAAAKNTITFWMNNTGQYGEVIREDITELTEKYGEGVVIEAMREAIRCNVRTINYMRAIAERMASGRERNSTATESGYEPVVNPWELFNDENKGSD